MKSDRETSSATTLLVLEYVGQRLGEQAVQEVVDAAQVPYTLEQLRDPAAWVSYDTRIRLFEQATLRLGDPEAMFRVGSSAVRAGVSNPALIATLRALGSPRQVFRQLPRAVSKFSTTSTMQMLDVGPSHALIRYTLHEGYQHSRLDCLYAQGLFSVVPELFGLPAARIVHDECESDGYPACTYHVTWARRSRWRRRAVVEDPELGVLRAQLDALHAVAADLVSSDSVEEVLQRITEKAASAVVAPAYLLAVERPQGGEPMVLTAGLDAAHAEELAARLLAGGDLGRSAIVVDVASSRRHYGRLAALHADGQRGLADETRTLGAYASHAAVALDLLVALEGARVGERRAQALLGLSHRLARAGGTAAVADVVAGAVPEIVGSQSSAVLLWDASAGELRTVACEGLPPEQRDALLTTPLRPEDHPELVEMLGRRQPRVLRQGEVAPGLQAILEATGVEVSLAVPLMAGDDLLGVTTTGWRPGSVLTVTLEEAMARLGGIADQAATALQNARLVETITHQSLHDDLTGLPNRVLFGDRLDHALQHTSGVAVLFCDLDRFKSVNDVLGHAAGDELLRQVAARLRSCLRPGDSVGRLSGDEFAVLLPGVDDGERAEEVARRVVWCFDTPFRIEGRDLRVTTSVGVAVHRGSRGRADRLLRAADSAMYVAKQRGRNQIARADEVLPGGGAPAADAPTLEHELAAAIGAGQLRLHYQPVVEVTDAGHRVVEVEALLRWEHPRLGLLPPSAFLPLAEESRLVVELDLWALRVACAEAALWHETDRSVSVNLSSRTLSDARLPAAVRSALTDAGLPARRLCVEVVESQSLVDLPSLGERLQELRQMGVRIALDDFGTGFSTLSWLQRLPVDRVKLDRTFVAGLPDHAAQVLVRGVVALADQLGVELVGEGVETPEQLAALTAAGCRLLQGYLLGQPAPGGTGAPALPSPRSTVS